MQVARLALQKLLDGRGYDVTASDVLDAYQHLLAAAHRQGLAASAIADATALAQARQAKRPDPLAAALLRALL